MGDCYTPAAIQNFVSKDVNRIVGDIIMADARRNPFIDVLPTGKIENQIGGSFRAVVQSRTLVAASLTVPTFTVASSVCRTRGGTDRTGTVEYTYQEGILRGQSEEVCVNQAKQAFKRSWIAASQSLRDGMIKLKGADIRGQILVQSGIKATVRDGATVDNMINGDQTDINTPFLATASNAFVTFKLLKKFANRMFDDFMVDPFEQSGMGTMYKWIGSRDSIDRFRDELDIKADLRALTTGRYALGEKAINGFEWDGPYRGIAFGADPRPLRAAVGGGGYTLPGTNLQLVEPEIEESTTNGVRAATNPAWLVAPWEIGFLFGDQSFRYLAGTSFAGEGDVKFPNALAPTTLEFVNIRDNDCNLYGDMGRFIYQIARGYEPMKPHAVLPVLYRRCNDSLNLDACGSDGNSL